jgi:hypothetical protein
MELTYSQESILGSKPEYHHLGFSHWCENLNSCKDLLKQYCSQYVVVSDEGRSRGSSGSIVSDYGLDDRAIGVRFPTGAKDFSSSLCVQTGSGAHPASCTMGTGGKSAAGA